MNNPKTCRQGCPEIEWRGPGKNTCKLSGRVIYDQDKECLFETEPTTKVQNVSHTKEKM